MAAKVAMPAHGHNYSELQELTQTLTTTQLELNYEKSSRIVEGVAKDEEIRKLKFRIACMEDEMEELNEQLAKEEERADLMLQDLEDAGARADDLDGEAQELHNELRIKCRELETARAEVAAMSDMSNDTTKVLKEKLALARELSILKPELEHLRSQAASNQELLSEKLSLQRQLSTVQVELDNAKRSAERATSKTGKNDDKIEDYKTQIEDLKRELKDAKTANKQISTLEKDLASSRKEIETFKSKSTKTAASTSSKAELEALEKELATEKKERARIEKALEKEQASHEAQRSTLEDKLASFRTKLRSTKEKLKSTEAELSNAHAHAATANVVANAARDGAAGGKKTKDAAGAKRNAKTGLSVDPDAMLGTPGDHAPAKRGRKAATSSHIGDKSTFSMTPFLNRTMSLAPDSPPSSGEARKRKASEAVEEEDEEAECGAEVEDAGTPSAAVSKKAAKKTKGGAEKDAAAKKPKALAPASSAKQNSKPPSKRSKTSIPTLEKLVEEDEEPSAEKPAPAPAPASEVSSDKPDTSASSSDQPAYQETNKTTTKVALGTQLVPKLKTSNKPRKSLLSFAAFNDSEAATSEKPKKAPKRKLLGSSSGLGKTLFDEDDGEKLPSKPVPGRGLFAKRGLLGAGRKGALGGAGGSVEESGFVFSPLKKDRRAMALAQSMLGN